MAATFTCADCGKELPIARRWWVLATEGDGRKKDTRRGVCIPCLKAAHPTMTPYQEGYAAGFRDAETYTQVA